MKNQRNTSTNNVFIFDPPTTFYARVRADNNDGQRAARHVGIYDERKHNVCFDKGLHGWRVLYGQRHVRRWHVYQQLRRSFDGDGSKTRFYDEQFNNRGQSSV